jgi:hypothetical protein
MGVCSFNSKVAFDVVGGRPRKPPGFPAAEALGQGLIEVERLAPFWLRWSEFDGLRAQKYAHVYDQSAIAD